MLTVAVSGSMALDVIVPRLGDREVPSRPRIDFGGTAGNVAYNLSRLGLRPLPVCAVGGDGDFADYAAHCRRWGIDLSWVKPLPGEQTARAQVTTGEDGEQITYFHSGALKRSWELAVPTAVDIALQCSTSVRTMRAHVAQWQRAGTRYYLDPGQTVGDLGASDLLDLMQGAAGLFLNDREGEMVERITGTTLRQLSRECRIVRTRGASSVSLYQAGEERLTIPAVRVKRAIDPTGCGDAFRGGFFWGVSQQLGDAECLRAGTANAAAAVQVLGAQNHVPSPRFLAKAVLGSWPEPSCENPRIGTG